MIAGVADTHVIIWYLYGDKHLSATAKSFIDAAADKGDKIGVSPITLVEAIYLIEKGKIPAATRSLIIESLRAPDGVFVEVSLDLNIAEALARVDRARVPDMPDRIVAATALYLSVPVISRDRKIQVSGLDVVW